MAKNIMDIYNFMGNKIHNNAELTLAFKLLEPVFQADENTQEAEERDYLLTLIEDYENQHYAI